MSYWIESRRRSMSNCLAHRESIFVSVAMCESYENFGGDVFGLCRRASLRSLRSASTYVARMGRFPRTRCARRGRIETCPYTPLNGRGMGIYW